MCSALRLRARPSVRRSLLIVTIAAVAALLVLPLQPRAAVFQQPPGQPGGRPGKPSPREIIRPSSGLKAEARKCPPWVACPMDGGCGSGAGPSAGDPVNLATMEEE